MKAILCRLAILMMIVITGCTSVRVPMVLRAAPTKMPLNMGDCTWEIDFTKSEEKRERFKQGFFSEIGKLVDVNLDTVDPEALSIVRLRVDKEKRGGFGYTIFPIIFSTPIVPLSFIRNRYNETISVSYALVDPDGKTVREGRMRETIRSSFSGWSLTRLIFMRNVIYRVRREAPAVAAEMVVEDIASNFLE